MVLSTGGLAIAALSSFFNGSFPAWQRCSKEVDPVFFNGLVCCGAFLSSLPVPALVGKPYMFNWFAFCCGAIFVFAVLFSFIAIPKAGLATSQAVWSTSAIIVSFCWGSFGPKQISASLTSLPLSLIALFLLVTGALIIVGSRELAACIFGRAVGDAQVSFVNSDDEAQDRGCGCASFSIEALTDNCNPYRRQGARQMETVTRMTGLVSAMAVGLFGGSILVPFKFIPPAESGIATMPSFGLGALVLGSAVSFGYWRIFHRGPFSLPDVSTVAAGIMSGATWNAGNLCSILAQGPPFDLPYGLAYPILQCAMLFGGMWGIYVFREIRGGAIFVFWIGVSVLVGGVAILSLYGPGTRMAPE